MRNSVRTKPPASTDTVVGVLLAGGAGRRMGGGDKCLRMLGGQTLLRRALDRLRPQVQTVVLNANGDPSRFADFELPVAADVIAGQQGPLAGVLTGMEWAVVHVPACRWIVTIPTDAPLLPADLVVHLIQAGADADLACAASGGRMHPVVGLWPVALREPLRSAIEDEQIRKVDAWTARYRLGVANFDAEPIDPFFNMNRPEDLAEGERLLARLAMRGDAGGMSD